MNDSPQYLSKKRFFESLITLYGRNVALEVLRDETIKVHKLHLSTSNRVDETIRTLEELAHARAIPIAYHTKEALSRISKNSAQDQGVALDIHASTYRHLDTLESDFAQGYHFVALDGIHNPQNLGMILRSIAASRMDGIILPKHNSAKLSPLVMKASAGTMFKLPIYYCDHLDQLTALRAERIVLSSHASSTIEDFVTPKRAIFLLGNESEGVSEPLMRSAHHHLRIPMARGVESLNVAITAALISFMLG